MTISAGKQSTVIAALLLRANQIVPAGALSTALWGGEAPLDAHASLATHVDRLRQALGPETASRIQTVSRGYRLELASQDQADHILAEHRQAQARVAATAGDWERVDELAEAGLALWRGDPLQGISSTELCGRFLPHLRELRTQLRELRVEARLALGDFEFCLPELRSLADLYPLRDPLYEREFAALYGAGRRADAQALFRRIRVLLRDELGAEPSKTLQVMYELSFRDASASELLALLTAGTRPRVPGPAAQDPGTATARTSLTAVLLDHHFPAPPRRFVGREAELAELGAAMAGNQAPEQPGLVLLVGMAGVGKSSLALAWAHRAAADYPDGRLYLDLKGFAERGEPLDPDTAIRILLDLLGVREQRLPATPAGRAALYRSTLAERRLLIVLDNATNAEQVRALLPTSGATQVLAASRNSLASLVTIDFARTVRLGPFSAQESLDLLHLRLGPERSAGHEAAIAAIAERCAHLPLALVVAAGRAWTRPGVPLEDLAAQLESADGSLGALNGGDPAINVGNVLSWSYRQLDVETARLFRLLSVHPGPDISIMAAASLAGRSRAVTHGALVELDTMNMLEQCGSGRYRMHNLLRSFGQEQCALRESDEERGAAYRRLLDSYLHTSIDANRFLTTHPVPGGPSSTGPAASALVTRNSTAREAMDWFEAECEVLLHLTADAAAAGLDEEVWQLASTQSNSLARAARWSDDLALGRLALRAARRLGDPIAEATALRLLARCLPRFDGETEAATRHVDRALKLSADAGDALGVAESYRTRGNLRFVSGNVDGALADMRRYLEYAVTTGHAQGRAIAQNSIGWFLAHLGREREGLVLCRRAVDLMRGANQVTHIGHVWDSLGLILRRLADPEESAACYREAIAAFELTGDRHQAALAHLRLGEVLAEAGDLASAEEHWCAALPILSELGRPEAAAVRQRLARVDADPDPVGTVVAIWSVAPLDRCSQDRRGLGG